MFVRRLSRARRFIALSAKWLDELAWQHHPRDVARARAELVVDIDRDRAVIKRQGTGEPLYGRDIEARRADQALAVACVDRGVYGGTPTRSERVALLSKAARLGRSVEVHAPVLHDGTYAGRLAIDGPRRAMARLGRRTAEPGDRRAEGSFVHAQFDDEELILEAASASLAFEGRHGEWVRLVARGPRDAGARPEPFWREVARVLRVVRDVETRRRTQSPREAVRFARAHGRRARRRGPLDLARLRRAVGWVDRLHSDGGNCLRRVLLELSLDAGRAEATLTFGLDVGRLGHVSFAGDEERRFDVAYHLGPEDA